MVLRVLRRLFAASALVVLAACGSGPSLEGVWLLDPPDQGRAPTSATGETDLEQALGLLSDLVNSAVPVPIPRIEFHGRRMILDGVVTEVKLEREAQRIYLTIPADALGAEETIAIEFLDRDRITLPGPSGPATYRRERG